MSCIQVIQESMVVKMHISHALAFAKDKKKTESECNETYNYICNHLHNKDNIVDLETHWAITQEMLSKFCP